MREGMWTWVIVLVLCMIIWPTNRTAAETAVSSKAKSGWRLVFDDDFEGDQLDLSKWSYLREGERKDGYWSHKDAFLDGGGHLIIQVREHEGKYYSGAITTRGKFEQAYGYYEIRCQLPKEEGFWTAFWLMTDGAHRVGDEGRDGTEIDIYESPFSKQDRIQHALHWDGYDADHQNAGYAPYIPGIYEGFHTFALEWNEYEYIFYVDDQITWRTSAGGVSQVPSWVQITAEVGQWGGDIRKANLPAELVVDYVRVYERVHEIAIESPAKGTTVLADAPISFSIDPTIDIAQIEVIQDNVKLYKGASMPENLHLDIDLAEDDLEHSLVVTVTDTSGRVFDQVTCFRVRRTQLDLPQGETPRINGTFDVRGTIGLPWDEQTKSVELSLQPIRAFEDTEPILIYQGTTWTGSYPLDTLDFEDGAYDLIFSVTTTSGIVSRVVRRIIVQNWETITEAFLSPGSWFGGEFDRFKTVQRSGGWLFSSDAVGSFFGDNSRIGSSGKQDEYLIWQQPHLHRYEFTVYAQSEEVYEQIKIDVSDNLNSWQRQDYHVEVVSISDCGWLKLRLYGDIFATGDPCYIRLTLTEGTSSDQVQLGHGEIIGWCFD